MPEIPLRKHGRVVAHALVDAEDLEELGCFVWGTDRYGYARRGVTTDGRRETIMMHRVVLGLERGDGQIVDHINRNKLDNRRENLRLATTLLNARNNPGRSDGLTSRYRGVCWAKATGKWQAKVQGRYLGQYDTEAEAARVAAKARLEMIPEAPIQFEELVA